MISFPCLNAMENGTRSDRKDLQVTSYSRASYNTDGEMTRVGRNGFHFQSYGAIPASNSQGLDHTSDVDSVCEISDNIYCYSLLYCFRSIGSLFFPSSSSERKQELFDSNSDTSTDTPPSRSSSGSRINEPLSSQPLRYESRADITTGGIFNPAQNCAVNASLQAYKTAVLASQIAPRAPTALSHFLSTDYLSWGESLRLHSEMIALMKRHGVYVESENRSLQEEEGVITSQQDAGEFLSALLQEKGMPQVIFEQRFHFQDDFEKAGQCTSPDPFLRLTIEAPIKKKYTIQELIDANLQSSVSIKREDNSPQNEQAIQQLFLPQGQAPKILFVQLARYSASYEGGNRHEEKLQCTLSGLGNPIFLPELPLQGNPNSLIEYEPLAFVCHIGGSLQEGHYITYCKKNERWIRYDDDQVDDITDTFSRDDQFNICRYCYIIVYQKKEPASLTQEGFESF